MTMRDTLRETWETRKEAYLTHLKNLVSIDTHCIGHGIKGGLEAKGQEYLEALFTRMGADEIIREPMREDVIQESIAIHQEGNPGHNFKNRYNLYARFKGQGGRSLLFNGHMDTMPAGDESLWIVPPHQPKVKDHRLYGLGVCDMKGGLMAACMSVQLLADAGYALPGEVIIASVVDEEGGGNGSVQAAMQGWKADGVIVCEPTGHELIVAHMGFLFFRVDVEGKANHSGAKWLGVSAIEKAILLMAALNQLEQDWQAAYQHPLLPKPSLNIGTINGGSAASTVAGHCSFEVCIHYLPELMNHETVEAEFRSRIDRIVREDAWLSEHPPQLSMYQAGGSFEMDPNHEFVAAFRESYANQLGKELPIAGSPAGCDSRTWKNIAGCPTIQYGPGELEQCHSVNEYLSLDAYWDAVLVYADMILRWGKETVL